MIQLPWWALIIAVGIVFFLIALVARLSDKVRALRRIIHHLEGVEEEEIKDTESGDMEGYG